MTNSSFMTDVTAKDFVEAIKSNDNFWTWPTRNWDSALEKFIFCSFSPNPLLNFYFQAITGQDVTQQC